MYGNEKFIKRYYSDINLISYNNKDAIRSTWKNLKKINKIKPEEIEYNGDRPRGFDDLVDELPEDAKPEWLKSKPKKQLIPLDSDSENSTLSSDFDSESDESDDEICVVSEINIKGKLYILDGVQVFTKESDGLKGKLYGRFSNGKVIRHKSNEEFEV